MAGPQSHAFTPGASAKRAATQTTANVALPTKGFEPSQVRITVDGTDNAYIAFGDSNIEAAATDIFMLTGTTEVFTLPPSSSHIAALADGATGCTVYITAGNGM